jgi:hypothetical protein
MKKLLNRNQFFQNAVFAPWREYIFCIQASRQKLPSDNQQAKLARTKNAKFAFLLSAKFAHDSYDYLIRLL